jgi:hypothetical protein
MNDIRKTRKRKNLLEEEIIKEERPRGKMISGSE